MIEFVHLMTKRLLQAVGLTFLLALALSGGAMLGNKLAGWPYVGAALGAGCFAVALIQRLRHKPNRADLYFAALLQESPYRSLPLLTLAAGTLTAFAGTLGGLVIRNFASADKPVIAAISGTVCAVAVVCYLLRDAIAAPITGEADHGNAFGGARKSALSEMLKHGISKDYRGGIWLGVWEEWIDSGRLWWEFWKPRLVVETSWLTYRGENSAILAAPPGSGKFSCSAAWTLLLNEVDSIIMFDPKGQGFAVTARQRREGFGQETVLINPLGVLPGILPPSAQINPLGELDPDSPTFESDIKTLVTTLVPMGANVQNPYFPLSAQGLTAGVMIFAREFEGPSATLPRVAELLYETPPVRNAMFEAMATRSRFAFVQGIGNRYWLRPAVTLPQSADEIISTAQSEMDWLLVGVNKKHPELSTGMARLFGYGATGPLFSWPQLKQRRMTVYIVMPVKAMESFAKMTKLLIGGAVDALVQDPVSPVIFLCDELPNALGSDAALHIRRAFNVGRFAGLRVQGIVQSWEGLETVFSQRGATGIRGAAGLLQFFGSNDEITSDIIRREMGNKTIWTPNTNPTAEFGLNGGVGATAAPLLTDQDLKDMHGNGGQIAFLLGSGGAVVMNRTPHYFDVPLLRERADPDPYHEKGDAVSAIDPCDGAVVSQKP